jgi:hypothetical protein
MSGGPNVTAQGEVAGVNVAHRRDGELVSFLVPATYAQKLFASITPDSKAPADFKPIIGEQLLAHQTLMMDTLLASPLSSKKLGPYSVPVRESEQLRCWGSSDTKGEKTYTTDQINCAMESELFVSEDLQTGSISMTHRFVQTDKLDPLRFSIFIGKMFSNRVAGDTKDENVTTSHCTEEFIGNNNFTSRAVVCVESYQKFAGLYNFLLFTSSTDEPLMNLQSRLVINGVSFENGQKFIRQFLAMLSKEKNSQKVEPISNPSDAANDATEAK